MGKKRYATPSTGIKRLHPILLPNYRPIDYRPIGGGGGSFRGTSLTSALSPCIDGNSKELTHAAPTSSRRIWRIYSLVNFTYECSGGRAFRRFVVKSRTQLVTCSDKIRCVCENILSIAIAIVGIYLRFLVLPSITRKLTSNPESTANLAVVDSWPWHHQLNLQRTELFFSGF